MLRLLKLARPVQEMLMDGALEMGHARALLALDGVRQIEAGKRVAAKGLSVRETEALVNALLQGPSVQRKRVDRDEAHRMVGEIKGYKLFTGFRGRPKSDVETIEKNIVRLSNMVVNHPEIMELDINPLLVHEEGKGATVADCRIILKNGRG